MMWLHPRTGARAMSSRTGDVVVIDSEVPSFPDELPLILGGVSETRDETIVVNNPHDDSTVATVARAGAGDVDEALRRARPRAGAHTQADRAEILERTAERVATERERFAQAIMLEAAKPIRQARVEVERCVDTLRFAAIEARTLTGELVPLDGSRSGAGKLGLVNRAPVGTVGAITPFNFPLNLVAHKLGPAVAAGCPVVLKPAEQAPISALLLGWALIESGLEPGDLSVLPGAGAETGAELVAHPEVAMITFTGSSEVGWAIRSERPRTPVALELGNSTPVIVHHDADIERAAASVAASGFSHAGQSCISVQRVYVHRSRYDRFAAELVERVRALRVGDPADEATDLGPLIDRAAQDRVERWIDEAIEGGAEMLESDTVGGVLCPTLVADPADESRLIRDEVFGPVVSLQRYEDIADAIARANGTPFGLQAGVFTADLDAALAWASRLEFAGVTINETPTFRADQQPYGGIKDSGNTREGPRYAVRSMTDPRLVVISRASD